MSHSCGCQHTCAQTQAKQVLRARADGAERYHVALHAYPRRVAPVLAPSTGVSYMCACVCNNSDKSEAAGCEGARGVGREAYQQKRRQTYSTWLRDAGSARPRSRPPEPPSGGSLAELWPSRSDHSLWPDELRKEGNGSATITPASRGLYPAAPGPRGVSLKWNET